MEEISDHMSDVLTSEKEIKNNLNKSSLLCILVLFILRIPVLGFCTFFFDENTCRFIEQIYGIGTYIFTALFIWIEREKLEDYHIDKIVLLIFTLGPLWYVNSQLLFRIPMMIIGLLLLVSILVVRTKLPKIKAKIFVWLLIGIIAGIALETVLAFYEVSGYKGIRANLPFSVWFIPFIMRFMTQITNAAIFEEPFFRGILWGYLRKKKWKEIHICLFQAGLFMLGHTYYINWIPFSFWIFVPLSGFVLGLLVWRSRSIATSMFAHGIVNSLGDIIGRFIVYFIL
jgi:membrane protease YdiL (CAAX protease family)